MSMTRTAALSLACCALLAGGSHATEDVPGAAPAPRKLSGRLRGMAVAAASSAATSAESSLTPRPAGRRRGTASRRMFSVTVDAGYRELKGTAVFLVAEGSQANHVQGGDTPYLVRNRQGEGIEFKKWGFIVNILPVADPNDPGTVSAQMQVELSGPVKGAGVTLEGQSDRHRVPEISTAQLQTEFHVALDRKTLIASSPLRVEVTLTDAP